MAAMPLRDEEIEYPTSDGRPMAESNLHRKVMADLIAALERRYVDEPRVWAGGNFLLYYEQGNPRASVSPDMVLVRGIRKWDRPLYKLWEEGKPPDFVIEVTSNSTRREDMTTKKNLYQRLGVAEYVLFDPTGDYLHPRLQGYRLEQGHYLRLAQEPDGSLLSRITNLRLQPEKLNLRLIDSRTGEKLLWTAEKDAAIEAAERKAEQEAAARQVAEHRAEEAERKAKEEAAARSRLEEELANLRAEHENKKLEA
ncbi:MAG TPA: Uma2 family endonuclease [Thermoanaerobaculia bacterium]|jgi:Uma2 family endonuclease|nr:Uma2 family endonuclease [Thermoanaerobaculia bacterium]